MANGEELDVRPLAPALRRQKIFAMFHVLSAGEAFVLVNDHDPKPLYYQFQAEHPDEFAWDYLESGPEVWRVRIGKS
ncbi:hemerythrin [Carbonactinospora thermoautotrophica]|uniref:Hemerythrin n=1 Tax=Carbonactinospora thermoautotrophica TaxID=1469144 RepID=A0A132N1F3_9ACTN|nr:hemerythrin [Carbonactinospora thermoautotrophica]KWX03958.1 hemerythrin [Carbonactinospora thermoautotrophica]